MNYPFTPAEELEKISTMSKQLLILGDMCSSLSSEDQESIINQIFSIFQLCLPPCPNLPSSAILETITLPQIVEMVSRPIEIETKTVTLPSQIVETVSASIEIETSSSITKQ